MSFQDNDTGAGFGVEGTSSKRIGVVGRSSSGPGVLGETQIKVEGNPAISSLPVGVMGVAKLGVGIIGIAENGSGASGGSVKGAGVVGNSSEAEGVRAISGKSHGVSGRAINGAASGVLGTHAVDGNGVSGVSQGGNGVYGQSDTNADQSNDNPGSGVFGYAHPEGYGVYGYSPEGPAGSLGISDNGFGVFGQSMASTGVQGTGTIGVVGNGTGLGVKGSGTTGIEADGTLIGVNATGSVGVQAKGDLTGVSGDGGTIGVMGTGTWAGVCGQPQLSSGGGLLTGLRGTGSSSQTGVSGTSADGRGVWGLSTNGSGVEGFSAAGHAGWFNGDVNITGKLTKSSGKFVIDHPLAPETMYLNHSLVESPEMKNLYDGVVALDARGEATIKLPRWFEALNGDFRYQLTALGDAAPNLHVASEIRAGRFRVAGGKAKMKVCWQVTGVRHDAWAKHNPIVVEEKKVGRERGKYRHPEVFGKPEEMSIYWNRDPDLLKALLKQRKRGETLAESYLNLLREQLPPKTAPKGKSRRQPVVHANKQKSNALSSQVLLTTGSHKPLKVREPVSESLEKEIMQTALRLAQKKMEN